MSYALLSETFPKAAKDHKCIWCGEPIPKGLVYRHEKSVYDGNMQDHKWHKECHLASCVGLEETGGEFMAYSYPRGQCAE